MRRRRNFTPDPRIIIARFDSKCAETGEIIKKGERCLYYPIGRKVYKLEDANGNDTKQYYEYKNWKMDTEWLNQSY